MMLTPQEAIEYACPLGRTHATGHANCQGDRCILWRWEPLTVSHPKWAPAVRTRAAEADEKPPYAKAAAWVNAHRHELGIEREKGWCGLGGAPT